MTSDHDSLQPTAAEGLPVAPSLTPALDQLQLPRPRPDEGRQVLHLSLLSGLAAIAAAIAAELLLALINGITNLAFLGRLSLAHGSPADNQLGWGVVLVPVIGGLVVGVMARFGSPAIRGHGIPEAMERILKNESRIAPRLTLLKPVSSAVAIGTGGPFGAEGPIIATGGALGSLLGQVLAVTADERKVLLAAGAAAGMSATFGSPVAAVLLAIELLLFEYRPRSLVPVAFASAVATAIRMSLHGSAPAFDMAAISQPGAAAMTAYVLLGAGMGLVATWVTRAVYAVEDAFERLPVHWMWWPALGGLAVGLIGLVAPRTLGVGYENIDAVLTGSLAGRALLVLVVFKLASWALALGSGTSGGTLAPLFTIGGGVGALAGGLVQRVAPAFAIDVHVAGLVGMAAMFAGASRALLASIVFAFETTRQPMGLLPLLAGCSAAYLVSMLRMRHTIMTERLARRGTPVGTDYSTDHLAHQLVRDHAAAPAITLRAEEPLRTVRQWLAAGADGATHQGFPVVNDAGRLVGVVTRRDLTDPKLPDETPVLRTIKRPAVVIYADNTLREAADQMVHERVGRLPVVTRDAPATVVGIVSRSDLLTAHEPRLQATWHAERTFDVRRIWTGSGASERRDGQKP
jgi:H+/Cl- antiporter ClcA/CBS domain-containing protein